MGFLSEETKGEVGAMRGEGDLDFALSELVCLHSVRACHDL